MRTIKVYEEVTSIASTEDCDGYIVDGPDDLHVNRREIPVTVDDLDIEEHETESAAYAAAVKAILDYGSLEPSSFPGLHVGLWYSTIDGEIDYATGETTLYSIHLDDFTEEEQRMIWQAIA